ncbi:hypothetical protein K0M31_002422 [Melipona bicolor]|uniref:Uncharacterized protein n=1 Tax=Melipona bicolor TaxID=60889 RepID=A0AA40KYM7_9HYME|nr:hypothetical protein K0M31_002422 [Melipona bicolor]
MYFVNSTSPINKLHLDKIRTREGSECLWRRSVYHVPFTGGPREEKGTRLRDEEQSQTDLGTDGSTDTATRIRADEIWQHSARSAPEQGKTCAACSAFPKDLPPTHLSRSSREVGKLAAELIGITS